MSDSYDDSETQPEETPVLPDDMPARVDLGGGVWLQSFRSLMIRQPESVRAVIPDDHPFWLNGAWLFGGPLLNHALLVRDEEQTKTMQEVNAALASVGVAPIPTWGPSALEPFYGDAWVILGEETLARSLYKIHAGNCQALEMGAAQTAERLLHLKSLEPVATQATLALVMAREVVGKNLLACDEQELAAVHDATGKLLLSTASASGRAYRTDELPALYTPPIAPHADAGPLPGQYI